MDDQKENQAGKPGTGDTFESAAGPHPSGPIYPPLQYMPNMTAPPPYIHDTTNQVQPM